MSKEDLAWFKPADVKLLALQWRKAVLDEMVVELEQKFSWQSLGASSGQPAQVAAHHVHLKISS